MGAKAPRETHSALPGKSKYAIVGSMKTWIPLLMLAVTGLMANAAPSASRSVAERVWQNECGGSVQGLVSWNAGEAFPSLGIGHFIWYPAGQSGSFAESFPPFVAFAEAHGTPVPTYLHGAAPWPNRAAFQADRSGLADRMRRWLAANLTIQMQFLHARAQAALPTMLRHSRRPQAVRAWFEELSRTQQGMYCLVDYVNFKGEGVNPSERYSGQGWGLLQVLEEMRGMPASGVNAPAEFARAAEAVMRRRVQNAPSSRGETRWLQGWVNRCRSYKG